MPTESNQTVAPLLRLREASVLSRRSKASIYRGVRDGTFPAPVALGVRSVAWHRAEIEAWVATRPRKGGRRGDGNT